MQQGNAAPLRSNTDSSSATAAGSAVDAGGAADSGEGAEGQGAHGGQSTLAVKLPLGGLERSLPVPGWTMSEAHAPQGTRCPSSLHAVGPVNVDPGNTGSAASQLPSTFSPPRPVQPHGPHLPYRRWRTSAQSSLPRSITASSSGSGAGHSLASSYGPSTSYLAGRDQPAPFSPRLAHAPFGMPPAAPWGPVQRSATVVRAAGNAAVASADLGFGPSGSALPEGQEQDPCSSAGIGKLQDQDGSGDAHAELKLRFRMQHKISAASARSISSDTLLSAAAGLLQLGSAQNAHHFVAMPQTASTQIGAGQQVSGDAHWPQQSILSPVFGAQIPLGEPMALGEHVLANMGSFAHCAPLCVRPAISPQCVLFGAGPGSLGPMGAAGSLSSTLSSMSSGTSATATAVSAAAVAMAAAAAMSQSAGSGQLAEAAGQESGRVSSGQIPSCVLDAAGSLDAAAPPRITPQGSAAAVAAAAADKEHDCAQQDLKASLPMSVALGQPPSAALAIQRPPSISILDQASATASGAAAIPYSITNAGVLPTAIPGVQPSLPVPPVPIPPVAAAAAASAASSVAAAAMVLPPCLGHPTAVEAITTGAAAIGAASAAAAMAASAPKHSISSASSSAAPTAATSPVGSPTVHSAHQYALAASALRATPATAPTSPSATQQAAAAIQASCIYCGRPRPCDAPCPLAIAAAALNGLQATGFYSTGRFKVACFVGDRTRTPSATPSGSAAGTPRTSHPTSPTATPTLALSPPCSPTATPIRAHPASQAAAQPQNGKQPGASGTVNGKYEGQRPAQQNGSAVKPAASDVDHLSTKPPKPVTKTCDSVTASTPSTTSGKAHGSTASTPSSAGYGAAGSKMQRRGRFFVVEYPDAVAAAKAAVLAALVSAGDEDNGSAAAVEAATRAIQDAHQHAAHQPAAVLATATSMGRAGHVPASGLSSALAAASVARHGASVTVGMLGDGASIPFMGQQDHKAHPVAAAAAAATAAAAVLEHTASCCAEALLSSYCPVLAAVLPAAPPNTRGASAAADSTGPAADLTPGGVTLPLQQMAGAAARLHPATAAMAALLGLEGTPLDVDGYHPTPPAGQPSQPGMPSAVVRTQSGMPAASLPNSCSAPSLLDLAAACASAAATAATAITPAAPLSSEPSAVSPSTAAAPMGLAVQAVQASQQPPQQQQPRAYRRGRFSVQELDGGSTHASRSATPSPRTSESGDTKAAPGSTGAAVKGSTSTSATAGGAMRQGAAAAATCPRPPVAPISIPRSSGPAPASSTHGQTTTAPGSGSTIGSASPRASLGVLLSAHTPVTGHTAVTFSPQMTSGLSPRTSTGGSCPGSPTVAAGTSARSAAAAGVHWSPSPAQPLMSNTVPQPAESVPPSPGPFVFFIPMLAPCSSGSIASSVGPSPGPGSRRSSSGGGPGPGSTGSTSVGSTGSMGGLAPGSTGGAGAGMVSGPFLSAAGSSQGSQSRTAQPHACEGALQPAVSLIWVPDQASSAQGGEHVQAAAASPQQLVAALHAAFPSPVVDSHHGSEGRAAAHALTSGFCGAGAGMAGAQEGAQVAGRAAAQPGATSPPPCYEAAPSFMFGAQAGHTPQHSPPHMRPAPLPLSPIPHSTTEVRANAPAAARDVQRVYAAGQSPLQCSNGHRLSRQSSGSSNGSSSGSEGEDAGEQEGEGEAGGDSGAASGLDLSLGHFLHPLGKRPVGVAPATHGAPSRMHRLHGAPGCMEQPHGAPAAGRMQHGHRHAGTQNNMESAASFSAWALPSGPNGELPPTVFVGMHVGEGPGAGSRRLVHHMHYTSSSSNSSSVMMGGPGRAGGMGGAAGSTGGGPSSARIAQQPRMCSRAARPQRDEDGGAAADAEGREGSPIEPGAGEDEDTGSEPMVMGPMMLDDEGEQGGPKLPSIAIHDHRPPAAPPRAAAAAVVAATRGVSASQQQPLPAAAGPAPSRPLRHQPSAASASPAAGAAAPAAAHHRCPSSPPARHTPAAAVAARQGTPMAASPAPYAHAVAAPTASNAAAAPTQLFTPPSPSEPATEPALSGLTQSPPSLRRVSAPAVATGARELAHVSSSPVLGPTAAGGVPESAAVGTWAGGFGQEQAGTGAGVGSGTCVGAPPAQAPRRKVGRFTVVG